MKGSFDLPRGRDSQVENQCSIIWHFYYYYYYIMNIYIPTHMHTNVLYTTCFPWGHFLCPYRFILNNISPRKLFMSRQPNVPICHFELRHFLIPYWQLISWAHSAVTGSLFSSSCWLPMLTFTYVFVTAQERKWSMTHVTHDLSPKS